MRKVICFYCMNEVTKDKCHCWFRRMKVIKLVK